MAYVTVPKDLTKIKSKVMFNLTKRQLLCFGAAVAIGLPLFFLTKDSAGTTTAALCMVLAMLPMFLLAMYEKNGQPLEVIIRQFVGAILEGKSWEDALHLATATGALCVQTYDALSGIIPLDEVQKKIAAGWEKRK